MFARPTRFAVDQRGSSAVEFAIIAPMFFMALIGVIIFGWSMNCMSALRLALEDGGRALEVNQTLTEAQLTTLVKGKLSVVGDPTVTVTLTNDTSVAGVTMKRLTGTYAYAIKIPFLPVTNVSFQQRVVVPLKVV